MGAIYMNLGPTPLNRGNVIHTNFFHDVGEGRPLIQAVYADDGSMGLTVHSNVFYRVNCGEVCHAVHGNGASYINVTNNVFVDCGGPYEQSDKMMLAGQYEQLVPHWKQAFAAANASGAIDTPVSRRGACFFCDLEKDHWLDAHKCATARKRTFVYQVRGLTRIHTQGYRHIHSTRRDPHCRFMPRSV